MASSPQVSSGIGTTGVAADAPDPSVPVLPASSPAQTGAQQLPVAPAGPSLELQKALWDLVTRLEQQDELARRREIRAILQRRLYWRGEQYWWWNEYQGLWFPPYEQPEGQDEQQQSEFQHVTNIFQAFSSLLMSVLSQHTVPAQFYPQSPSDLKDQSTAKKASIVSDYIHRNNDMDNKADDATYFMCTDGFIGNYIRFVSDGEAYGYDEEPELEQQEAQVSPGGLLCESCGYFEEGAEMAPEEPATCPECGEFLTPQEPMTANIPVPTGQTKKIPKGQEVMTVIGALELKRNMWANEQKDFLYLTWITDLHRAKAKSLYPELAKKFEETGGNSASPATAVDTYERLARRLLYVGSGRHAGADIQDLGTFRRVWLRPCAFWNIPNETLRAEAMQLYPMGAKVIFFNDVFCEAQEECMDDCWESMQTMPGEGQFRETLTSSLVPVQDQLNDCSNLEFEIAMHGVPEGFGDGDTIDFEARDKSTALPGQMTEVHLERNENLNNRIMWAPAVEPSVSLQEYRMQLFTVIPQFLCGGSPALAGGDTGGNDTAAGISIQRNQALGRIGRAWRRLQTFWCNSDAKAVKCFAKNRTQDVEMAVIGDGGNMSTDVISLEDLQGNLQAFPEVDQQYPVLQAELRALLYGSVQQGTALGAIAMAPDNVQDSLKRMGFTQLQVPGQDQQRKTYLDIEELIKSGPVFKNGVLLPTIQPDPEVDRLDVAADTMQKFMLSDRGLALRLENPDAYANCRQYLVAARMEMKAQQLQQAMAAAGAGGTGPAADLGGAQDMVPPDQQGTPGEADTPPEPSE